MGARRRGAFTKAGTGLRPELFTAGSAATRLLGCCYKAIPGFAKTHGRGSFSDQHHDLDVTWGMPLFRDTVIGLRSAGG